MLESLSQAFTDLAAFVAFLVTVMRFLTDHTFVKNFRGELKALTVVVLGLLASVLGHLAGLLPGTLLEALAFGLLGGVSSGGFYSLVLKPFSDLILKKKAE